MKKLSVSLAAATAVLAMAGTAWSGYKQSSPVSVDTTSRWAAGSFGSTRNSADTGSYVACYQYAYPADASPVGICVAWSAAGVGGSCVFQNKPVLSNVLASISSDSWIYFTWDANNQCTTVRVDNGSFNEPKK